MTLDELRHLAPKARLKPGASERAIAQAKLECGIAFPVEYRRFLLISDGLEGFVRDAHLMLWSCADIGRFNRDYEIAKWCPSVVAIGSDGGGESVVVRRDSHRIGYVPFIPMEVELYQDIAGSFDDFLRFPLPPSSSCGP